VTPAARTAVGYLQVTYAVSQRRACRPARAQWTMIRYLRRLHVLLRRELSMINRKRDYRLYRLEGLMVRRRKRKRVTAVPRVMPTQPWRRGEAWAMDLIQDTLADGRCFRTLNVLDSVSRECLAIEVDTSLRGQCVVRVLEQLMAWHGAPKRATIDLEGGL
jgi:putative transposase